MTKVSLFQKKFVFQAPKDTAEMRCFFCMERFSEIKPANKAIVLYFDLNA